jgi:hypothetical protein
VGLVLRREFLERRLLDCHRHLQPLLGRDQVVVIVQADIYLDPADLAVELLDVVVGGHRRPAILVRPNLVAGDRVLNDHICVEQMAVVVLTGLQFEPT